MELNVKDQSTHIDYTHSHDGLDEPTIVGQKRTHMENFFMDSPFSLKMTSTPKVKAKLTMESINRQLKEIESPEATKTARAEDLASDTCFATLDRIVFGSVSGRVKQNAFEDCLAIMMDRKPQPASNSKTLAYCIPMWSTNPNKEAE